jgi:hypothetical protein
MGDVFENSAFTRISAYRERISTEPDFLQSLRRLSRRQRNFSIESDCLGPPEADSLEIGHFSIWWTETGIDSHCIERSTQP